MGPACGHRWLAECGAQRCQLLGVRHRGGDESLLERAAREVVGLSRLPRHLHRAGDAQLSGVETNSNACSSPHAAAVYTWVIVTSDHSELFGEHRFFGHGPIHAEKIGNVRSSKCRAVIPSPIVS